MKMRLRSKDSGEKKPRRFRKAKNMEAESISNGERVTNSNLEHHRQAVLSKGKKFKYPFYHSRHRVVIISSLILIVAVLVFLAFSVTRLYRYRPYDDFSYALTEVIPFPVAKVDGHFVSYQQYLFELKSNTFGLEHVTGVDFSTTDGQRMLLSYQRQALDSAETYTYARTVAKQKGITVSADEVQQTFDMIEQHSLNSASSNNQKANQTIFDRTIREKYNWSEDDLKRSITELLYKEKVAAALDDTAAVKAENAVKALAGGQDFAQAAAQYSDDTATKGNGGLFGTVTSDGSLVGGGVNNKANVPDVVIKTLFSLNQGQVSGIIKAPEALYIIKNLQTNGNQRQLAYIRISYQDLSVYMNQLRKDGKIKEYIKLPAATNTSNQTS